MRWLGAAVAASISLFSSGAAWSAGEWVAGADDAGEARVEARIVIHPTAGDGERIRAGVQFRLDPGWHLYWKNPGDSGIATDVAWRDADASAVDWPAPHAFEEADGELVTFGYSGELLLTSWLAPALGAHEFGADVAVLVCRASCIPADLALTAPFAQLPAERAELIAAFAAHDAALPVAASTFGASVRAERGEDAREAWLTIAPCDRDGACSALAAPDDGPAFFAETDGDGFARELTAEASDGALRIALRTDAEALGARLRGVVRLAGADGAPVALAIDEPLLGASAAPAEALSAHAPNASSAGATGASASASASGALLAMLGIALLGGLVLNLMPCVLPVLALKVFAVGELAGQSRRDALRHGLAYAAGIELSMLALAGVALALRGAGHAVGWGFQFQEPAYIAAISAVLTGFALNLFGVFEIGFQPGALASVGAGAAGARRSFFEGLLAVALATPCSAPFLGTAIGFAFASPALTIALVFLAIGAGLALPFVAISAFPRLGRFMPRSGAWMGTLRSGLGFALLASVVWLLWIVGRSAGADASLGLLAVLLAGSFVAWVYGRLQQSGARFAGASAALAVAALVLGGANWVRVTTVRRPAAAAPQHAESEAWSALALQEALAAGKPAFVYFTADWCLTCKLNERLAVDTDETRALLEDGGFAVLRGDWTQRDEAIRVELARHGKAGVPLYLVYSPDAPGEPRVLSELLTQERLNQALRAVQP